ncbi:MAG: histidine kinase N-terminal 7TM domain-containing protein [Bacillota bacterium]|nr:histidine kinase N-terminal 7TM domain-containing protein [Bacillota bacterium]
MDSHERNNFSDSLTTSERYSLPFLFFTVFLGIILIFFIYHKAKKNNFLRSFIFMNITMIIWAFGLIVEYTSTTETYFTRTGALLISYIGICFMGYSWLVFCMFSCNFKWIEKPKNLVLLAVPSIIFYLLQLTNYFHEFMYIVPINGKRSFGPGYYILSVTVAIYIIAGIVFLLKSLYKNKGRSIYQNIFLLFIITILVVHDILRLFIHWNLETTPLAFMVLSTLLFSVGSIRYNFFSIVPVSFLAFIQSMEDGMLVLDIDSTIVSFNRSIFKSVSDESLIKEGRAVQSLVDYLNFVTLETPNQEKLFDAILQQTDYLVTGFIYFKEPKDKCVCVTIQPLLSSKGKLLGRIVTFSDITGINQLNKELQDKNNELTALNNELVEANEELLRKALMLEEFAVTKERNRILGGLYHSIEKTFRNMLSMIEVSSSAIQKKDNMARQKLSNMIQLTKEGLNEIRDSIYDQRNKSIEVNSFLNTLEKLFETYSKLNMSIQLFVEGTIAPIPYHTRYDIYIACKESLDNSSHHGNASLVYIIFQFKVNSLNIIIMDNGKGCKTFSVGSGLKKIESISRELKGRVYYGSPEENQGFSVRLELPLG